MEEKDNKELDIRQMLQEMANYVFYDKKEIEEKIDFISSCRFGDNTNYVKSFYDEFLKNKDNASPLFNKLTGLETFDLKYRKCKSRKIKIKVAGYSYIFQFVDDTEHPFEILKPVKSNIGAACPKKSSEEEDGEWLLAFPLNRNGWVGYTVKAWFKFENGKRTSKPLRVKVFNAWRLLEQTFVPDDKTLEVIEI